MSALVLLRCTYCGGAFDFGRPAIAVDSGYIHVSCAERTEAYATPHRHNPLAEVVDILTKCLMVRAGVVITEEVAIERARNCAQAIAHLVAGSGYE